MTEESNESESIETESKGLSKRFALLLTAVSDWSKTGSRASYGRLGLLLAAVVVVFFGIFTRNLPAVGIGLLAVIAAFYRLPDATPLPVIPTYYFLAVGALFLAAVAGILTNQDVHNPLIPALWIASMVIGLVAAVKLDRTLPQTPATGYSRANTFFKSHVWLIPVILVAFALRIYRLEAYPPLHGDEGEMGLAAMRVLTGDAPPPTATGWLDHPALFHYLQAVPLAIFGRTGFGLRLLSVMAGVLCVPIVYVLGRRGWGPVAGLTAAWFLAVAHLHVHYSRIGLNNIESTFFLLLFLLLMTRIRPQRVSVYVLAGLVVGLAQYMYFGSRVILLIAALLLLFTWRKKITDVRQLAAFGAGLLLALIPLAAFYFNNPDPFVSRARFVFIFNGNNAQHILQSDQVSMPKDALPLLGEQLRRNLNYFVGDGDLSPFYISSVPALDIVTGVLFWLGLGLALTRLRRFQEFAVLVWLGLGIFIGGVLTIDAPNSPRLLIVIPAVVLLAGIFVQRIGQLLSAYPRRVMTLLLIVVFAAVALLNVKIYFYDFDRDLIPGNLAADSIAREFSSAGESSQAFLLGQPHLYAHYGTIHFLAGDEVRDLETLEEIPLQQGTELLFIALPNHTGTLDGIKQRWPGGESFTRLNSQNLPMYDTYSVQTP
jgi:4-amino-4-deoxy-L-arabinose transferase-like glycosyltransferase